MKKIDPHKPLTDKEWEAMGPWKLGVAHLPKEAQEAINNAMRGRPALSNPKKSISIRLDADLIEKYRSQGKGWQTQINSILRQWVENRP